MARRVRLVRRVVATSGGWAGDGTVWNGDNPSNAPKAAATQATEATTPVFSVPAVQAPLTSRGAVGILRVIGSDSTRRFDLRIVACWVKTEDGQADLQDWQQPAGPTPPTAATARDIGDGEDFSTLLLSFAGQDIAFHLVPKGGNLASGSRVEIWATSA